MRCHTPFMVEIKGRHEKIPINCGKCPYCKKRRVSSWVFRLLQEEKVSFSSYFVTLTYDTRHLPFSKNGYPTLVKKDFQNWMKRLRKIEAREPLKLKLKYYACGEYGTKNWRPHYHTIIFNVQDVENLQKSWQAIEPETGEKSQIGSIHIGSVSGASIAYTAKYIDKQRRIPIHKNDDRLPEFSLQSTKLGTSYLTPAIKKWHRADLSRMYVVLPDGVKVAMPKYYRDQIFNDTQKETQRIAIQRIDEEAEKKLFIKYLELYPNQEMDYDHYKEMIKHGQYTQFYAKQNRK